MSDAIDAAALDAQTFGDRALALEILGMFRDQSTPILLALAASSGQARGEIAHRLKGSALAIGALALAGHAAALEAAPDDAAVLAKVETACAAVRREIDARLG
jgi:HPt (histidine-containing phosphotransfer) domain-containing protein